MMIDRQQNLNLKWFLSTLFFTTLLMAGCISASTKPNTNKLVNPTPRSTGPLATPHRESAEPTLELPPATKEFGLSSGEVPQELFDNVLADLLANTGADPADLVVLKSESVIWNDGSLGCPQPDVMYTQSLIDGYQIVFRLGKETFDYHINSNRVFLLCENEPPFHAGGEMPTK